MTPERWRRLEEIFHGATGLDPAERPAYLDDACAGDAELRQEVEALIDSSHDAASLPEQVLRAASAALDAAPPMGTRAGPYRIVSELGQGGMARVFLALRDDDQFQRRVAVKIAHTAQAPDMLSRFRSERQILAALDHPNMARLLDGGTTGDGVPYLVLEYVEGEPIDRYCDSRQLAVQERLQIFRTVCGAVQYAHQNLVVHRDLKPANVLVTPDGIPKLLDFGIAKLLKPELLGQAPLLTTALNRLMTPEYASPEQVRGEPITTATDVYSLGVLLYELLTGCRPLRLEGESPTDLARIVSEVEPEPPSAAALWPAEGTDGRTAEQRSRLRGVSPEKLRRMLEGDLDNILLMALRKAPARRYASVDQLSDDLRRYLEGLTVRARKDTIRYRARKFMGRNRYWVGTAAAFFALVAGFGINRAQLARELAAQRDHARQEAATAQRVALVLQDLLLLADPYEEDGTVTGQKILDRAAEDLGPPGSERPEVHAALLDTIGSVYLQRGLYPRAEPLLQQALEERRAALGGDHLDTARSLLHMGVLRREQSRPAEAETLLGEALRMRERLLGVRHLGTAEAMQELAVALRDQRKSAEAESLLRRALALREADGGDDSDLAVTLDRLSEVLEDKGELAEAEAAARRALEISRRRPGKRLDTARHLGRLGAILRRRGRLEEAEAPLREALATRIRLLGQDHRLVAINLGNLANVLRDRGDLASAEPVYRQSIAIYQRVAGDDHLGLAATRADFADLLLVQGRLDEAEDLFQRSLAARRRLGEENPLTLASRDGLARVAAVRVRSRPGGED